MARKLVLLIDYEASVRVILQVCLHRLGGWDVLAVSSVQQGLEILMTNKPDAILLDVPMLEADSFLLVQEFRDHPFTQSIPIVLVTAKARWFSPHQLQQRGIAGAIAKPFNPVALPTQVATILHWN